MCLKPIPSNYLRYMVSDTGVVTDVKRRPLAIRNRPKGLEVTLVQAHRRNCPLGTQYRRAFLVHRLVYETHVGEIPKGYYVKHINGNTTDNRPENLYLSQKREKWVGDPWSFQDLVAIADRLRAGWEPSEIKLWYGGTEDAVLALRRSKLFKFD